MKLSKNKEQKVCKRTSIGGQAVIEGIMMNGPHKSVLAVRSSKGEIIVEDVNKPKYREKCGLFKIPVVRGVVAYVESMVLGYRTLMRSADLSGMTELEDEEDVKARVAKQAKKQAEQSIANEGCLSGEGGTHGDNEIADNAENMKNAEEKSAGDTADEKAAEEIAADEKNHGKNDGQAKDDDSSEEPKKLSNAILSVVMIVAAMLGVGLALFLFMYIPTIIYNFFDGLCSGTLTSLNLRGLIEGLMKLAIFIVYIVLVSFTKDIKRLFQYHGAEHKTIFCYEHGLELTVENVKKQRRFHPRCGTSFLFLMIAVGILFSTLVALFFPALTKVTIVWVAVKILLIPIFCGVGYELLKICGKYDNLVTKIIAAPGLWVQRLTTKEPDDSMMEVAIESIKAVIPENPDDDRIGCGK